MKKLTDYPAHEYALAIKNGKKPANELVKLTIQRYFNDIENCKYKGFYFDVNKALHAISFFGHLKHWKGIFNGQKFILSDFQHFIIWNLFGWYNENGLRRFRNAYIQLPRKNGLSSLAAGINLYMFLENEEREVQCLNVGANADHAKLSFRENEMFFRKMTSSDPNINLLRNKISCSVTLKKLIPFWPSRLISYTGDSNKQLKPHSIIYDNFFAFQDTRMYRKLQESSKKTNQPLTLCITTPGEDPLSLCYLHRAISIDILKGISFNESWFAMIYEIDDINEWTNPEVIKMVNPNFGQSINATWIHKGLMRALKDRSSEKAFKRLHLGYWDV